MEEKLSGIAVKVFLRIMLVSLLITVIGLAVSNSIWAKDPSHKESSFDDPEIFVRHYREDGPDVQRTVKSSEIVDALLEGKSVDISGAIIEGDIELNNEKKADTRSTGFVRVGTSSIRIVKGELKIIDSTVRGALRVCSSSRKDRIVFTGTVQLENVIFEPGRDRRSISVKFTEFFESINLNFCTFKGNLVFEEVLFRGPVNLFGSRFRSEDDEREQYGATARFSGCAFENTANFESAILMTTRFKGSTFNSDLILRWVGFEEMNFENEPHRRGMIRGNMALTDAEGDSLKLSNLTIGQDLDLSGGVFSADGSIGLKDTVINGRFRMDETEIPRTVRIYRSIIGQGLKLGNVNVENNQEIILHKSRFSTVEADLRTLLVPPELTWWLIPFRSPGILRFSGMQDPIAFLRSIENNLRKEGNLADANKAMYIRYRLESNSTFPVLLRILDSLWGLGIRFVNLVSGGVLVIIFFGVLFYPYMMEKRLGTDWGVRLTSLPMRGIGLALISASRSRRLWWSIQLSTILFVKFNFGGNYLVRGEGAFTFAKIEWLIGSFWIIVFIYSLSGRYDTVKIVLDALL